MPSTSSLMCPCKSEIADVLLQDGGRVLAQMDAGADLVITQLFYDVERFFQFEKDCRSVGITAPIIPGAPGECSTPSG